MNNTITAQEIKRRGISAVDEALEQGPVHVIQRNRPRYVILSEEEYARRGQPIARVLPVSRQRQRPDHADLRRRTALLTTPSADLIRAERDER